MKWLSSSSDKGDRLLKKIFIATSFTSQLACTTSEIKSPQVSDPEFLEKLNSELLTRAHPDNARVLTCTCSVPEFLEKSCLGEFGYLAVQDAESIFTAAIVSVQEPGMSVELTAEESFGSHLLSSFFANLGASLVAGAFGSTSSHIHSKVGNSLSIKVAARSD
jgi:hypothetical protein